MSLEAFPTMQTSVPLKGYSTFGVGGVADYFYRLQAVDALPAVLTSAEAAGVPVFVLGGGSNVLFADAGFRGLVIRVEANAVEVVRGEDGISRIVAEAGAKWPALLEAMESAQLTGMEAMAGLPGTMGGAVAGNAGCFGTETADILESALIFDRERGALQEVGPDYFQFRYRWSRIKETQDVVLRVTLRLASREVSNSDSDEHFMNGEGGAGAADGVKKREEVNGVEGEGRAISVQAQRFAKQPPGRTSGSFFKNPSPDRPAGWLIDQCGLKGLQIGGAQISPKHANFFMNVGGATAADILALRDRAIEAVRERFGIELEAEVRIIPEKF